METVSYKDQVIWGTSLEMANEEEIEACYNFVKEYIETKEKEYTVCEQSQNTKGFIDVRWLCGEAAHSHDLCDKQPSIEKAHLSREIEYMVQADINIDSEKIINALMQRKFLYECRIGRIFFVK